MIVGSSIVESSIKNKLPGRQGFDWILLALAGMAAVVLFYRFHFGEGFLAYYHDDFFYYLKIAVNLVHHGISSFDGIHRTNGYHPLYMLVIMAMVWAFSGKTFFVMLQVLMLAAILTSYVAISRTLCLFTQNIVIARVAAAAISYFGMILMRGGMEIILTIPLASCLIYYLLRPEFSWTARQSFCFGLLASAVVLSRLDSILFFVLLACLYLIWQPTEVQGAWKKFSFFLLGALPVGIYVLLNMYWFHVLIPLSGQAKELRTTHIPTLRPFQSIFLNGFSPTRTLFTVPAGMALLLGLALLWKHRSRIDRRIAPVLWALLLFPLFHLAFYSIASDWSFFPWYFYPFVLSSIAACVAFLVVRSEQSSTSSNNRLTHGIAWTTGILFLAFSVLLLKAQSPKDRDVYVNALDIQQFTKMHPGKYAMGDRAGSVGYLVSVPVIQLEGLVEDKEYLEKLKAREPLKAVLRDYRVDYYVGANPVRDKGCYTMTEPLQGGPTAVKISGTFCQEPVAVFNHVGYQTVIFAVPHSANGLGSTLQ